MHLPMFLDKIAFISVFLVDPVSVSAVHGSTVEFTCTANNTEFVAYYVNKTLQSTGDDIFQVEHEDELVGTVRRRNLTVTVSSKYNNTEIFCRAFTNHTQNKSIDSWTAYLTVQGTLNFNMM